MCGGGQKKAVLQHLNLGKQPPKCNSMRVLEQPNESNDHHLVRIYLTWVVSTFIQLSFFLSSSLHHSFDPTLIAPPINDNAANT
jgi:hypothetical protein